MERESKLKKNLGPSHVWAIAFGCIVGWGSFVNPGKKFLFTSGVAGTAISMALGALVMIIISFSYAYLIPKFPKAGGEFTFTKSTLGKKPAYICGWFLVAAYLTNVPMNSTAIGLIIDGIFGPVLKWGFHYTIAGFEVWLGEIIVASSILILFGILNIIGVKKAGIVQTILACLLVVSIMTLFISAWCSEYSSIENLKPLWGFDKNAAIANGGYNTSFDNQSIASSILATFAIAPWAFVGFDTIPQAAEEFKFSYKKVIFIMIIAILFGCFVYVSNNTVAAIALENWPDLIVNSEKTPWLLLVAAEKLLGPFGKALVGIAVSCAVLSGIMGFYLASSRLLYSMSCDGYLPKAFSVIDKKHSTPKNAIIFCILISLTGPILGREALGWFLDMSAIGASIGYFFTCLVTFILLRKDEKTKINAVLKVLSAIGLFFSCAFIFLQLIPIPGLKGVNFCWQSYVLLAVWIVLGFIFYMVKKKKIDANEKKDACSEE